MRQWNRGGSEYISSLTFELKLLTAHLDTLEHRKAYDVVGVSGALLGKLESSKEQTSQTVKHVFHGSDKRINIAMRLYRWIVATRGRLGKHLPTSPLHSHYRRPEKSTSKPWRGCQ